MNTTLLNGKISYMVADCGIYRNDKVFAYADDDQQPESQTKLL
jgi:hypothetical protein